MRTHLLAAKFILCSLLFYAGRLHGQDWTWMHGTNLSTQYGVYGTQGVAAPLNKPGARVAAVKWKDANGNFWLFGGGGFGSSAASAAGLSDLWKYDLATNQWTWVAGPNSPDQPGAYGTQGVAAAGNNPGGRQLSVGWTDNGGNLWLYGGYGATASSGGSLGDLWKFDISLGQWAWVNGSSSPNPAGVYGTQGVAAAANTPGARKSPMTWTDNNGDLWLFGGTGTGLSALVYNDLWKYNIASNQWTWMNGTSTSAQTGVYGTQGVAAAANMPGARSDANGWTDNNGNLWLFGGSGNATTSSAGLLNDLWKYTVSTNQWTWMKGTNTINPPATYGTLGVAASANTPGGRWTSLAWKDNGGNLWLFGGEGYITTAAGKMNDVWKYNVITNKWSWMKGANTLNQYGTYGTLGTSSPANTPGAREGLVGWNDNSGNFWLFGGYGYQASTMGYLNDLWRLVPCGPAPAPPANISSSFNQNTCIGNTTTLSATSGANDVVWFATPASTNVLSIGADYTVNALPVGTYTFYAQTEGCQSSASRTGVLLTVNALPTIAVNSGTICSGHVFTLMPSGAVTYTYSGGSATVMPSSDASYSITGTSAAGCVASNTAVSNVSVNPTPVVTVNSGTVCAGASFTLNPSGAATYTISGGSDVVSPAATTSYTVTGSGSGCTSLPVTSTVIVNPTPTLTAAAVPSLICVGGNAVLSVAGASTYAWDLGSSSQSVTVSPTLTTHYTVTGTNPQGCSKTATVSVVVSNCTGLQLQENKESILIFPNPNNGEFTIRSAEHLIVSIINELGQTIRTIELDPSTATAETVTGLDAGIYFITGASQSGRVKQKIVVDK